MARKKSRTNLQDALEVTPTVAESKVLNPEDLPKSVVDTPTAQESMAPRASIILAIAEVADGIVQWGMNLAARDAQLRTFFPTESTLLSAVYSVAARDASFKWTIVPKDPLSSHKNTVAAATRMLENVGFGKGWVSHMMKTCVDLYTQDNGAFWELIRKENKPNSPVVTINYLDAARCTRTGDPIKPVIYQDRKGIFRELWWYQVFSFSEMPSPIETMYDAQYCAVTRALRWCQILKSIFIYKDEKVSGRNARALDFVSGVGDQQIKDAMAIAEEQAANANLLRYVSHVLIPGIDPTNAVSHVRVDLASLPDNFNFDDEMKWYIAGLSMAFGVDYQEFAPLASGAMGSSSQSEILHLKTHGKGPAMIMALFEYAINNCGILPPTVVFKFMDHDARTKNQESEARYIRARDRSLRIQSGEIDGVAARYLAIEDGDLPEWVAKDMEARGVEADPSNNPVPGGETTPNGGGEMSLSPDQIEGGQNSQMMGRDFARGGMRGIEPENDIPAVTASDVNKERRLMAERLADG